MLSLEDAYSSVNDRLSVEVALIVKPLRRKGEVEWESVKRIVATYLFVASRFPSTHDKLR